MSSVMKNDNDINEFINALQLSIESTIDSWTDEDDAFSLGFSRLCENDAGLKMFEKLNLGKWNAEHTRFRIPYSEKIALVTSFLMLSRLNLDNIQKLAETKVEYRELASQMELATLGDIISNVSSVEDIKEIIFPKMKQMGMTVRQLSEKTGLSQTALSNFKSGKDIHFSNLIEIVKALGLKIKIT